MAAARDAFDGVDEGLRALADFLREVGNTLKEAATICGRVTKDCARASYNIAGEYTLPIEQEFFESDPPPMHVVPLPGKIVLSPLILTNVILSVTLVPLTGNSLQSLSRIYVKVINLALNKGFDETEEKRGILRHVYGIPGGLLGGLAGCLSVPFILLGRTLVNSCEIFPQAFSFVVDPVLPAGDELKPESSDAILKFAIPGIIVAAFAGLWSAMAICIYRFLKNSIISFVEAFQLSFNIGLPENFSFNVGEDTRTTINKAIGAFGYLLGSIAGLPFAFIANSMRVCVEVFKWFANLGLHPDDEFKAPEDPDDELSLTREIIGVLGVIPGIVSGVLGLGAIVLGRIITNTAISFLRFCKMGLNVGLPTDKVFGVDAENRNKASKAYGLLGAALGAFVGFSGALFITNAISLLGTFLKVTNVALHRDDKFHLGEDKRTELGQRMSALGILVGGLFGLLGIAVVSIGRWMTNSSISFKHSFLNELNSGLPEDKFYAVGPDLRSPQRLSLGILGSVSGSFFGIVAAVIASSAISTVLSFKSVCQFALHPDEQFGAAEFDDKRRFYGKAIGGLGLLLGGLLGLAGMFAIGSGRVVTNTFKSFGRTFIYFYNQGIMCYDRCVLNEDKRNWASHAFGVLGMATGGIVGLLASATLSTLISFAIYFQKVTNIALDKEDELKIGKDNRADVGHVLGVLGIPLGVIGGLFGLAAVVCGRIITNSGIALGRSFSRMTNLALHNDDRIRLDDEDRNAKRKFIFGPLGYLIGGIAGIFGFSVVVVARLVIHTAKSFKALGASLLNCGLQRAYFRGVGADRRPWAYKAVGALGYVTAAIFVTPLSAMLFLARHALSLFSITLGLATSPLVVFYKLAKKLKHTLTSVEPRFPPGELNIRDQASVIQGFKNIYSSLTSWGRLPQGGNVAVNADGSKSRWTFFRKSITFNARTLAEKTLDMLLADYRAYAENDEGEGKFGANFFQGEDFTKSIQKVKNYYENSCCTTPHEVEQYHDEIEKLATFIKRYMTERINQPEVIDVGPPGGLSWRVAFWGDAPIQQGDQVHPEAEISPAFVPV